MNVANVQVFYWTIRRELHELIRPARTARDRAFAIAGFLILDVEISRTPDRRVHFTD